MRLLDSKACTSLQTCWQCNSLLEKTGCRRHQLPSSGCASTNWDGSNTPESEPGHCFSWLALQTAQAHLQRPAGEIQHVMPCSASQLLARQQILSMQAKPGRFAGMMDTPQALAHTMCLCVVCAGPTQKRSRSCPSNMHKGQPTCHTREQQP